MSAPEQSPREMARAFTAQLSKLVEDALFSDVWADPALSPRDLRIGTVAALVGLYRPEQRATRQRRHPRRACRIDHASRILRRLPCGHLRFGNRCADAD